MTWSRALRLLSLCGGVACGSPQPTPPLSPAPLDPTAQGIPPPPDLPAVPVDPDQVCEPFDLRNPACRNDPRMCMLGYADCKCPTPPDVANPACWATMPCPDPPDRRVRACLPQFPPCPDPPDDTNPRCPASIVVGRVVAVAGSRVTIAVGAEQGIASTWTATLLAGDSDAPLAGGAVRILRIARRVTTGEVSVDADTLAANPRVRFTRPGS